MAECGVRQLACSAIRICVQCLKRGDTLHLLNSPAKQKARQGKAQRDTAPEERISTFCCTRRRDGERVANEKAIRRTERGTIANPIRQMWGHGQAYRAGESSGLSLG